MPWLKLLHIGAVIVWCAALLYLPVAIAIGHAARRGDAVVAGGGTPDPAAGAAVAAGDTTGPRVLRGLYTAIATPAALLAIASGTAVFVLHGPLSLWLVAKLAVVSLLVLGHAACGMLILRSERRGGAGAAPARCTACTPVLVAMLSCLAATAWLVLAKPF